MVQFSPDSNTPTITIDGPSGSGKGTVALKIASELGWHYLDSGALYRVLGLLASRNDVPMNDIAGLLFLAKTMDLRFDQGSAVLNGEDLEPFIRSEEAGDQASKLASIPEVRNALLSWQRAFAQPPGLVADGRDMGTVVFPNAGCKIFLTASAESRAERRFNQLRLKGFDVNIRQLFEEITERDSRDTKRSTSPLKPADDAIVLDTTHMTIQQVVDKVLQFAKAAYLISE